jgi:hypothetical protein
MLNTKIYKPLEEDHIYVPNGRYSQKTENPSQSTAKKYAELAEWCVNNNAKIVDQGDYYEAVPIPEPSTEVLAYIIRSERDAKLSATDYLVVPDYSISHEDLEDVKVYRQALRDITEQSGFPKNVQWPVEPKFLSAKEKNEGSIGLAKVGL